MIIRIFLIPTCLPAGQDTRCPRCSARPDHRCALPRRTSWARTTVLLVGHCHRRRRPRSLQGANTRISLSFKQDACCTFVFLLKIAQARKRTPPARPPAHSPSYIFDAVCVCVLTPDRACTHLRPCLPRNTAEAAPDSPDQAAVQDSPDQVPAVLPGYLKAAKVYTGHLCIFLA